MAVLFQKPGGRQSLAHLFHLRVGKRDPYLAHFAGGEKAVNKLYVCAQKSYIGHSCGQSALGAGPHAGALYVDAYEVLAGDAFGEANGVFALAASEFKHYGIVVVEKVAVPVSFHPESL